MREPKDIMIDEKSLQELIDDHQHWLNQDCEGWENMRLKLEDKDLSYVNLAEVNLKKAVLHYVNLSYASMPKVNLSGATLTHVNMTGTNMINANMEAAFVRSSNFSLADMYCCKMNKINIKDSIFAKTKLSSVQMLYGCVTDSDLSQSFWDGSELKMSSFCLSFGTKVNFEGAILSEANLNYTVFSVSSFFGANLDSTQITRARFYDCNFMEANMCEMNGTTAKFDRSTFSYATMDKELSGAIPTICPETGSFIAWKKAGGPRKKYIIKLEIPEDARRISGTDRKCRCDKAKVLEIQNLDGTKAKVKKVRSMFASFFIYTVGKVVEEPDFNEDRWDICSSGIHFFMTRNEAVNY